LFNGLQNPAAVLKIRVSTVQFRPPAPIVSIAYGLAPLSIFAPPQKLRVPPVLYFPRTRRRISKLTVSYFLSDFAHFRQIVRVPSRSFAARHDSRCCCAGRFG